jgi:hypothetical protein
VSRRLTALLAAPALAAVLASGCADEAAAARVGDTTISHDDLMTDVEALAGSPALLAAYQVPEDAVAGEADADTSYSQEFVGFVLQQRIFNALIGQVADDEGFEVTDEDLEDAETEISNALAQAGGDIDDLSSSFREQLTEDIALGSLVEEELGSEAVQSTVSDLARETDIEVSSKYGSWDAAAGGLVPPEAPAGTEGDDAETQP